MMLTMRVGSLLRWRYGAAALAMSVSLAIPATASANASVVPASGSRLAQKLLNEANATVVRSGRTVFAVSFKFRQSHAVDVDAVNQAKALAYECGSCDAVAIAAQVVFVSEQNLANINAENKADATNYHCTTICAALAEAYQIVIADGDSTKPTAEQIRGMAKAAVEFNSLKRSNLDNAQIASRSADIIDQLVSALADEPSAVSGDPATPAATPAVTPALGPAITPALNAPAQQAELTQTSGPIINVYRDVQSQS